MSLIQILNEINIKIEIIRKLLESEHKNIQLVPPNDSLTIYIYNNESVQCKMINKNDMTQLIINNNKEIIIHKLNILFGREDITDLTIINKNSVKPIFDYKNNIECKYKPGSLEIKLLNINTLNINEDIIYAIIKESPIKVTNNFNNYLINYSESSKNKNLIISEKVKKFYNDIKDKYNYIDVRGDGNCFFAAVFVSLLVQILFTKYKIQEKTFFLQHLLSIFKNINIKRFFQLLINDINNITYFKFLLEYLNIAKYLVIEARQLTIKFFKEKYTKNTQIHGLKIANALHPISYDQYIKTMETNGECVEHLIPQLHVFQDFLGCAQSICIGINETTGDIISIESMISDNNKLPNCYILLRPGHYNALVPK